MVKEIRKVAVLGAGVMGASIAAHLANAGKDVILLDIVPEGADNRNILAESAVDKLLKADPAPLTHRLKARSIIPGNLEDDLNLLVDVDWIIEAVLERLDVKQALYKKVDKVRKKGSFVSSNTSTLPLHTLIDGMPDEFRRDFLITHFFNPPRYMRLLELVTGPETRPDASTILGQFADVSLGKGVVDCKDTPGFIANRIGCFWIEVAMLEAFKRGLTVEEADSVMGRPVGIPRTGVFGLLDLIGIDLMPLIAKAMFETLPEKDAFRTIYEEPELVTKMIADGYTGRKGKGGFYRLNKEGGKRVKEAINLETGDYAKASKPSLGSVNAAKSGLRALVTHEDKGGEYAWSVLSQVMVYAASLVPEIADDVLSVDRAMRWGYNWKYGPFELIDRLGDDEMAGPAWLAQQLEKEGQEVPKILKAAGDRPFYHQEGAQRFYISTSGKEEPIEVAEDAWMLEDKKLGAKPVLKTGSASLWDVGDGIACLEFRTKMNSIDPTVLDAMISSIDIVKRDFKGLIIGNDGDNFCVGANIGFLLYAANMAAWKMLDNVIKQGQDTYMALKYAPFPVVSAPSGMALGGGCELLLHSDAVQAHIETYAGLVEVGVGVLPGWGGCKEILARQVAAQETSSSITASLGRMFSAVPLAKGFNTMPCIQKTFEMIATAQVAKSAEQAKDMHILNGKSRISMNRMRVLPDAKALALSLAEDYQTPEPPTFYLPGKTARAAAEMMIASFVKSGKATEHDAVVSQQIAHVLSGGDTDMTKPLSEQDVLDLEREGFGQLIRHPATLARIEHMLETGKPLRN